MRAACVTRQRQQPLAGEQRIADQRYQDHGGQHETAQHDPARGRHLRAPARAPHHQREQHEHQREERGRAGQHHPPQPGDRRRRGSGRSERRQRAGAAGQRRDQSGLDRQHASATMVRRLDRFDARGTNHGEDKTIPDRMRRAKCCWNCSGSTSGSAVAFVGHPIHVMMVHFPIAFVVATLGVDVIYWWSGDPFWMQGGSLGGRHRVLERRGREHRRHRRTAARARHPAARSELVARRRRDDAGRDRGRQLGLASLTIPRRILPHGLALSALASVMVGFAGWHGGKLVFDHGVGILVSPKD